MSYAEDNNLDTFDGDDVLYGSDYDIDSRRLDDGVEFLAIPAWRMRDGDLIAIKDMDTSHIKNCIKMIYRSNGTWRHQYLRYFEAELRRRKYLSNPPVVIYIEPNN